MGHVKVVLKDGTVREFPRSSVVRDGHFLHIRDANGKETTFPSANVSEVTKEPYRW